MVVSGDMLTSDSEGGWLLGSRGSLQAGDWESLRTETNCIDLGTLASRATQRWDRLTREAEDEICRPTASDRAR